MTSEAAPKWATEKDGGGGGYAVGEPEATRLLHERLRAAGNPAAEDVPRATKIFSTNPAFEARVDSFFHTAGTLGMVVLLLAVVYAWVVVGGPI